MRSPVDSLQEIVNLHQDYEGTVFLALRDIETKLKSESGDPESLSDELVLRLYQNITYHLLDEMIELEKNQQDENKRKKIEFLQKLLDMHFTRGPAVDVSGECKRLCTELTTLYNERRQAFKIHFQHQIESLFEAVKDAQENKVAEHLLVTSIQLSLDAIESSKNKVKMGKRLCLLAENLPGKSSLARQILGGVLMSLGIVAIALGVLIAIKISILTLGLGLDDAVAIAVGSSALLGCGVALLNQGRRKGLSRATHCLGEEVVAHARSLD